jgi:hypothetical protein
MNPIPTEGTAVSLPAIQPQLSTLQLERDDIRRLAVLQFEGFEASIEQDDGSKVRGLVVSSTTKTSIGEGGVDSSLLLVVKETDTNQLVTLSAEKIESVWLCSNGTVESYYSRSSGR